MEKIFNYIGGEHVPSKSNEWIDNYNPSNGTVYSFIPDSNDKNVENAQLAAQKALNA